MAVSLMAKLTIKTLTDTAGHALNVRLSQTRAFIDAKAQQVHKGRTAKLGKRERQARKAQIKGNLASNVPAVDGVRYHRTSIGTYVREPVGTIRSQLANLGAGRQGAYSGVKRPHALERSPIKGKAVGHHSPEPKRYRIIPLSD